MTGPIVRNQVRSGFYLDSVALMRFSREVEAAAGVITASMMIGTPSNKALLEDAGLLADEAVGAGPNDLIIAIRGETAEATDNALLFAGETIDRPRRSAGEDGEWTPRALDSAIAMLPDANLAIISVPGAFAAREAHRALRRGLNVMMFSDNVPLEQECALKAEAGELGLLMMGPDCGSAIIGGAPLGFANAVSRGDIGIVAASGTGLQEVSTLIGRNGGGVSHAIGVGGRDLSRPVGGATTLAAIDALDADPGTARIVLISKPPSREIAERIFDRVANSGKHFTVCFFGMEAPDLPGNATFTPTLRAAAEDALGGVPLGTGFDVQIPRREGHVRGLFAGGTLCAEAQAIFLASGVGVASNAAIPGASSLGEEDIHHLLDLGADEYTLGRPHPMIDPTVRHDPIREALADPEVAVLLIDIVLGYGAHENPAGDIADLLAQINAIRPAIVASVCGVEEDPQVYSQQATILEQAGITVTPSNAHAAERAVAIVAKSNA
ncbi:MAG: acyl-CoA synthetase FdrA [Pseudomonadota bacterium]|nr:acyl-CoA synthetase FdrA [Pseudomonadota bacterium]